ncbi:hypothetical protein VTJ49DRAFT_2048 [Mycothermus thermophilus]|uniref:Glycosyltransferase family 2 protein n=1 Tax=Humicola insolens TaxID=85995 RepID=A0ABR3VAW6_HUMIN
MLQALVNVALMASIVMALHAKISVVAGKDSHLYWLLVLFAWRYIRFFVNLVAFWCYTPSPKPKKPLYIPSRDVTCVIPTVDPEGAGFRETLTSCSFNRPAKIIVVTVGDELLGKTQSIVGEFAKKNPDIQYIVERTQVANKRTQVARAVPHIDTDITVLLDDHVYWGPKFLQTMLYPFQDPRVGLVGTNKRVRRHPGLGLRGSIWNMLGATYLYRHNFEIRATNTVDGGVFVISGRTCGIRTEILKHKEFLPGYTNERFLLGLFGPLNADDDNYVTRFVVRHGWDIKVQYTEDTVMLTDIGVEEPLEWKFLGQCRRWVRTTWRSNTASLITDRTVWRRQPYCVYAVYLTSLTNFALFTDGGLLWLFGHSSWCTSSRRLYALALWILLTKTVKVFDYFRRNPRDIPLFPVYVLFAYFHSLIKLYTLFTFYRTDWGGRCLDQLNVNNTNHPSSSPSDSGSDSNPTTSSPTSPATAAYLSAQHPHIAAIRAMRKRIEMLRAKQAAHAAGYQKSLLAELPQLRDALEALRKEHENVRENDMQVRAALKEVLDMAAEVSKLMTTDGGQSAAESEMQKTVEGLQQTMQRMEGSWK